MNSGTCTRAGLEGGRLGTGAGAVDAAGLVGVTTSSTTRQFQVQRHAVVEGVCSGMLSSRKSASRPDRASARVLLTKFSESMKTKSLLSRY
jgi:hypothetical protein